jgi:hypothetical protein
MKTILIAVLFFAPLAAHAQSAGEKDDRGAQKSCDELVGQAKEACLKQGGTVKANKKDYTKRDSK